MVDQFWCFNETSVDAFPWWSQISLSYKCVHTGLFSSVYFLFRTGNNLHVLSWIRKLNRQYSWENSSVYINMYLNIPNSPILRVNVNERERKFVIFQKNDENLDALFSLTATFNSHLKSRRWCPPPLLQREIIFIRSSSLSLLYGKP